MSAAAQSPSPRPPVEVRPIGRVYLDAATYADGEKPKAGGIDVRSVRLSFAGRVEAWDFEFEVDFGEAEVDVKDVWLARPVGDRARTQIGVFKEPIGLEALTSSRFITFHERALMDAFVPGRAIGGSLTAHRPWWWVAGGLFGQEVDEIGDDELDVSEGWAATGRFVVRAFPDSTRGVHLGVGATRRTPDARPGGEGRFRFRSYPEAKIDRTRYLNTGRIEDAEHMALIGLEGVAVWGPVSVQAEHMRARVVREGDRAPVDLSGGYVFATWFPTGESRRYQAATAEFAQVTPRHARGAVEIAVRRSRLDLNDQSADVTGGSAVQWTVGVNWHISERFRWTLNHVWVDNGPLATGDGDFDGNDDFRVVQSRFQMWF